MHYCNLAFVENFRSRVDGDSPVIKDPKLQRAVANIMQRSERQLDTSKLVDTYVDVGLLPQLRNRNHQIFYGRRGTGKTHVMKVLERSFLEDEKLTVVYIDCRTLGSTAQFSDSESPLGRRCLALYRDFLLEIYNALLGHIVDVPSHQADEALEAVDQLASIITQPNTTVQASRIKTEFSDAQSTQKKGNGSGTVAEMGFAVQAGVSLSNAQNKTERELTEYDIHTEDKIVFPDLLNYLRRVLHLASTDLVVLVDEWSSLPVDIQPYLAEFLKRGLLPLNEATMKISALEYRCRFSSQQDNAFIGFELGADIVTAPELDDYYVFDRNPEQITDTYADVLFRHLSSELEDNYLQSNFGIKSGVQLASRLFTERATCAELSRACEGVVRDLINIFNKAFFDAQRRGRSSIDKAAIVDSARQWFEQDKIQYLDEELQNVLRRIVDDVIGEKRARSFLLPRELERHPVVQRLFDARVIHHMQRGYADKDNPGVRYNIYSIDYGTYVNLLGTSKQPELELVERAESDIVVPFNDKRSIRRIILQRDVLEN